MEHEASAAIRQATRTLLRPLISFLLRCGLGWPEFGEIARTVYVDVAASEYGLRGRPTNSSRIALLTGIGRKEVKRIRDALAEPDVPLTNRTGGATRILAGWHQDADYVDASGAPLEIAPTGPAPSFEALCRRHASDIPTSAMQKELARVGAIEADSRSGRMRVLRRYYMPGQTDAAWILNAGSVFADLALNIRHNQIAVDDEPTHFLGRAAEVDIDPEAVPAFRALLEERGQQLLEEIDDWLNAHRLPEDDMGERPHGVRLGAGFFMIKDN